ncbi:MAG TPA: thioesterase family protein [Thermoanaerobaculia bacterium]|nr:thioesterase family protein [Thermoanaerobaculia bacterium]
MTPQPTADELNPKFTVISSVHFDELDAMNMLHNSRYGVHVERAIVAWYHSQGRTWEANVADNPDQFHVVRDLHIEFLSPVKGVGTIRIDIWVEKIGHTSCVYGFHCSSADGRVAHARGERTIIKLDPLSMRPAPWTDFFRAEHSTLLKDLPAYA